MDWELPVTAIRSPERPAFPPFVIYDADNPLLTATQCQAVIDAAESKPLGNGSVGNGSNADFREDRDYRSVRCRSLFPHADELEWLFEIVRDRAQWTNDDFYRFHLSGMNEGMQYLRYDADDDIRGHYKWHQDYGGGYSSHRKLSVVIQLSPRSEYDGCQLRMFTERDFVVPIHAQGTGVIFPSWQPHMVTPITKGTRRALVCWISGPQFQ